MSTSGHSCDAVRESVAFDAMPSERNARGWPMPCKSDTLKRAVRERWQFSVDISSPATINNSYVSLKKYELMTDSTTAPPPAKSAIFFFFL